jgi:hypothetical protein
MLSSPVYRTTGLVLTLALASACGGATRRASSPQGKATTTAASIDRPNIERMVVADKGLVTMVERDGCLAQVCTSEGQAGVNDELRVRCPKQDRIRAWFAQIDKVTAGFELRRANDEEEDEEMKLPGAKVLTANGNVLQIVRPDDVKRLAGEMGTFAAELASVEKPTPGPASPAGWQMLHVTGPAHVLFAGTPARGVLEARVSTNGQYYCEFVANVDDSPMRATKSGYIKPQAAAHAIDEVLGPFSASEERTGTTYAAGVRGGTETRSNPHTTRAVFERFAEVQDALGDACLPELEAPAEKSERGVKL